MPSSLSVAGRPSASAPFAWSWASRERLVPFNSGRCEAIEGVPLLCTFGLPDGRSASPRMWGRIGVPLGLLSFRSFSRGYLKPLLYSLHGSSIFPCVVNEAVLDDARRGSLWRPFVGWVDFAYRFVVKLWSLFCRSCGPFKG